MDGGVSRQEVMKIVNRYIGVSGGYLGDFSYRTHADFYSEYCDVDANPGELDGTTRERFIEILLSSNSTDAAKILRGIVQRFPIEADDAPESRTEALRIEILSWAVRSEGLVVPGVLPLTSRADVAQAIDDTETLLRSAGGAPVSVDRVHTTLHAYLVGECERAKIEVDDEATIAKLVKTIRSHHPAIAAQPASAKERTGSVLQALAQALDALNPIRNTSSMAHPHDRLLDEPEAQLVVNAGRTMLAYLDGRLRAHEPEG